MLRFIPFLLIINPGWALLEYSGQLLCGTKSAGGNIVELWMDGDKISEDSQLDVVIADSRGNFILGDDGEEPNRKRFIIVKHACQNTQDGLRASKYLVNPFIPLAINLAAKSNDRAISLS